MQKLNEDFIKLTGVKFRTAGRIYFYNTEGIDLKVKDKVIVYTPKGLAIGEVIISPTLIPKEKSKTYNLLTNREDPDYILANLSPATLDGSIDSEPKIPEKVSKILRIATPEDIKKDEENKEKAKELFKTCLKIIKKHKLNMKLVDVELTHDGKKIVLYFTSNGRIDFRDLIKDLLKELQLRIELRQIDLRDESKLIGGMGKCGQTTCCSTFLRQFKPVSIKMAKDQNIALTPSKISGVCGRLLCCLTYETEVYNEIKKTLPKLGAKVKTPDGEGKVIKVNIFSSTLNIILDSGEFVKHEASKVKVIKDEKISEEYKEHIHEEELSEEELRALEDSDEIIDIKDTFVKGKPKGNYRK
jgi:cell fate regulator YaaT (PSP1 superfamily)